MLSYHDYDVYDLIPKKGFFASYLKYASCLTDAPKIYHVASALAIHSALVAKYIELAFPVKGLNGKDLVSWSPMHLWCIIVGPSGDRKSTAMIKAYEVVEDIVKDQMAGIGSTPESTFDHVGHQTDAFFFYPEGASMFGQFNAPYWAHGQGLFCDLYDGRKEYIRQLSGQRTKKDPHPKPIEIVIKRPRITLLCGIATAHLDRAKSVDWTGGLIGRSMLFYDERSEYMPTSGLSDEQGLKELKEYASWLRESLQTLNKIIRIDVNPAAFDLFTSWSSDLDQRIGTKSEKVRALFNRLPEHIRRVAGHYAISQRLSEVDVESMASALRLGKLIESSIDRVANILSDDPNQRNAVKIFDVIRNTEQGIISIRKLIGIMNLSYVTMVPAIQSLVASGRVRLLSSQTTNEKYLQLMIEEDPGLK